MLHRKYRSFLLAFAIGCLALFVPLLRNFHFESAMLAAIAGSFWAGIKLAGVPANSTEKTDFTACLQILAYLYLAAMPLLIFSLATSCFTVHGLGFWILLPVPSVFFGASIGRFMRGLMIRKAVWPTIFLLICVAVSEFFIEFFTLPQVYFYNHIWGIWPGPVYDESVTVSLSLFYYRSITIAWAIILWTIPDIKESQSTRWLALFSFLFLLMGYTHLAEFGIISPQKYLQEKLGSHIQTKHFDIYYDDAHYSPEQINRYALLHEFYLHEITQELDVGKNYQADKISSYLYAHPWQKKQFVGAKYTSYVPVWLKDDQIHIAKQQLDGSLKHELVHVVAKQFGNYLLNASWSIGMVEGLAVAVAGGRSQQSTIDQLVAADSAFPTAGEIKNGLSFWGFYGGRATVNYTTMGSFLQFLLAKYPVDTIKQAYQTGDVINATGIPIEQLVANWHAHLQTVSTDSLDKQTARQLFSIQSILEKPCPHTVSPTYRYWDRAQFYLAEKDTQKAVEAIEQAKKISPQNSLIWSAWAYYKLRNGEPEAILTSKEADQNHAVVQLRHADALFLNGELHLASQKLHSVTDSVKNKPYHPLFGAVNARVDSIQWLRRLQIITVDSLFSTPTVLEINKWNQLTLMQKAIELEQWPTLQSYAALLLDEPIISHELPAYFTMIEWLIALDNTKMAKQWLSKISNLNEKNPLRLNYLKQLQQLADLADFSEEFDLQVGEEAR